MLGIDIISINKVKELLQRHGNRFINRIFTEIEVEYIKSKGNSAETIAGMFAAKEAVAKAYGTGIGAISFKDITIYHNNLGKPFGSVNSIVFELSISHHGNSAIAVAYAEKTSKKIKLSEVIFSELFSKRDNNAHKGTYGRVALIGGSKGMLGSITMASNAALRTGSGLVYAVVNDDIFDLMSLKCNEVIVKGYSCFDDEKFLSSLKALAVGPGLGIGDSAKMILSKCLNFNGPLVIDADGLNLISKIETPRVRSTILTPHPGELAGLMNADTATINSDRIEYAKKAAKKYNAIIVLKGHETVVSDGEHTYINKTGNPGMATAGSGDVLTGIITSLLGQGYSPFISACAGVYLHGFAGDIAAESIGEYSMIAGDIIDNISTAINLISKVSHVE